MKSRIIYILLSLLPIVMSHSCTKEKSIYEEKILTLSNDLLFIETGKSESVQIRGSGNYNVNVDSTDIIKYHIKGDVLVIDGIQNGRTKLTITDDTGLSTELDIIVGAIGSHEQDSLALIDLYASTSPDEWVERWQVQYPMEYWKGVKLNSEGRVISLDLKANGLKGKFPKSVGKLFFLKKLDLSMNHFSDEIPNDICNLINLHYLKFDYMNGLNIDPQTIEDMVSLSQLDTLSFIDVNVIGDVPPVFDKFKNLVYLDYGFYNQDRFPIEICNLEKLKSLSFYNGKFGSLPYEISQLNTLEKLSVADNGLKGEIPGEISRLLNLKILNLSRNNLEGAVPNSLTSLKNLKGLFVSNNKLTSIPQDFSRMDSLQYVTFKNNNLQGTIPNFGNLKKLRHIDLSGNKLTGTLPQNLNALPALEEFYVNKNRLEGEIPETFSTIKSLKKLELQDNNLTGNIPESFANKNPDIPFWLNVINNRLTGELPASIRSHRFYFEGKWLFMPQQEGFGFSEWLPITNNNFN